MVGEACRGVAVNPLHRIRRLWHRATDYFVDVCERLALEDTRRPRPVHYHRAQAHVPQRKAPAYKVTVCTRCREPIDLDSYVDHSAYLCGDCWRTTREGADA